MLILSSVKWPQISLAFCLLFRFLLVGQTMPTLLDEDLTKDGIEALSSRPFRNVSRQTSRQMSLCGTPEKSSYRQLSVSDRSSIRVEEIIPAARVAIQVSDLCVQERRSPSCYREGLCTHKISWHECNLHRTYSEPERDQQGRNHCNSRWEVSGVIGEL